MQEHKNASKMHEKTYKMLKKMKLKPLIFALFAFCAAIFAAIFFFVAAAAEKAPKFSTSAE